MRTLAALILGAVVAATVSSLAGPRARLLCGVAGACLLLVAAAPGLVRMLPAFRLGRRRAWLAWHVPVSVLSLVLLLAHGNWRFGEPVTSAIWAVLALIVASGIYGVRLQQELPSVIATLLPLDVPSRAAIGGHHHRRGPWLEQIERAREEVMLQAERQIGEVLRSFDRPPPAIGDAAEVPLHRTAAEQRAVAITRARGSVDAITRGPMPDESFRSRLEAVFSDQIRPFLASNRPESSPLSSSARSTELFQKLRLLAATPFLVEAVGKLEQLCATQRRYNELRRLDARLRGWRRLHQPLTLVLAGLVAAHVIRVWPW